MENNDSIFYKSDKVEHHHHVPVLHDNMYSSFVVNDIHSHMEHNSHVVPMSSRQFEARHVPLTSKGLLSAREELA